MALSDEDYLSILRHLQEELRLAAPGAHERISRLLGHSRAPREALLHYLGAVSRVLGQQSSGPHGRVLDLLNAVMSTEDGGAIRGIRVLLSGVEAQLYGRDFIDLATLPDQARALEELDELRRDLEADEGEERGEPA